MQKIRPLALAIIKNEKNQILVHEGFDSTKNEKFYRPLGGGIEFGEKGEEALMREFEEEIDEKIRVISFLNCFENIFVYEGKQGHEIILLYRAEFISQPLRTYEIKEAGKIIGNAVWRSLEEIQDQKANLYPLGIEKLI